METRILSTEKYSISEICRIAEKIWKDGGLVAFPTETVYGLGGDGMNRDAAKKIYAAKGRPSDNPLILHIGEKKQLYELAAEVPENAEKLMAAFWPGPLTMVLKKKDSIPMETSGGLSTIAIRMPSHEVAAALLKYSGIFVAAPSANLSGRPSTTRASHVIEDLSGRVDVIIDGGDVPIGVESTIIDLTEEIPVLLRPGYITLEELRGVLGEVKVDPAITKENIIGHTLDIQHPKAPGMKYRHYAPKAPLKVISGNESDVIEKIRALSDGKCGIITVDEHLGAFPAGYVLSVGSLNDGDSIAHNLFDVLRQFDSLPVDRIYSEDFSASETGEAVMNRLLKAAGGDFLRLDDKENNTED